MNPGKKEEYNDSQIADGRSREILKDIKIWLLIIPGYLVFCSAAEVLFDLHLHLFNQLDDLRKTIGPGLFRRIILPSILFGLPAFLIIINVLAVLEMYYVHERGELRIRVKNKPISILIVLLSILFFGLIVIYEFSKQ